MLKRVFLFLVVLLGFSVGISFAILGDSLITVAHLSNSDETFNDFSWARMYAGKNVTHILWQETSEAEPFDLKLFHRQLPEENTVAISTGESFHQTYKAVVDANDQLHIVWVEQVGESKHLLYWNTNEKTTITLTTQIGSFVSSEFSYLALDNKNRPHVVWAVAAEGEGNRVYYWQLGETPVQISLGNFNSIALCAITCPDAIFIDDNDVAHIVFHDFVEAVESPYYWNSDTKIVTEIRGNVIGNESTVQATFINTAGNVQVYWTNDNGGSFDHWYWDSETSNNYEIPTIDSIKLVQDGHGNSYQVFRNELDPTPSLDYWSSVSKTMLTITTESLQVERVFSGFGQNTFHTFLYDDNSPSDALDIFYWKPSMSEPVQLNDTTTTGSLNTPIRAIIEPNDIFHAYWGDGQGKYFVYNSVMNTVLTVPNSVSSITNQGETSLLLESFHANEDISYWLLRPIDAPQTANYLWQSDTQALTPIPAVYAQSDTADSNTTGLLVDGEGIVHIFWEDNGVSDNNSNLHYWNPINGSMDLSDSNLQPGNVTIWQGTKDEAGNIYAIWGEIIPNEGENLFSAFTTSETQSFIHLPILQAE